MRHPGRVDPETLREEGIAPGEAAERGRRRRFVEQAVQGGRQFRLRVGLPVRGEEVSRVVDQAAESQDPGPVVEEDLPRLLLVERQGSGFRLQLFAVGVVGRPGGIGEARGNRKGQEEKRQGMRPEDACPVPE